MTRLWGALALGLCSCARAPVPVVAPVVSPRPSVGNIDGEPLFRGGDGGSLVVVDGGAVLQRSGAGWEPVSPPGRRISLDDGSYWVALGFTTDGASPRSRWIAPAHPRSEIADRRRELALESVRLPPALAARVTPQLSLMALVSTLEGRFADPATHSDDTAASLGIFQWAMERRGQHAAGSTLGRFFSTLSRRARTSEPLFRQAWQQCAQLGLTVVGGDLLVHKRRLSGAELEAALREEMGRGALRTYQLVAALDWIEEVRGTVARPGPRSAKIIGHDYAEAERGHLITLGIGGHTIEVRPSLSYTIGDFLNGPALATAVSLGVNRPRFVEAALWQASVELSTVNARVDQLLARIVAPLPKDKQRYRAADFSATLGDTVADAALAYAELQTLLWPRPDGRDASALAGAFTERALALYRPEERERRARRLATGR